MFHTIQLRQHLAKRRQPWSRDARLLRLAQRFVKKRFQLQSLPAFKIDQC